MVVVVILASNFNGSVLVVRAGLFFGRRREAGIAESFERM